jgi:hypothetical protein
VSKLSHFSRRENAVEKHDGWFVFEEWENEESNNSTIALSIFCSEVPIRRPKTFLIYSLLQHSDSTFLSANLLKNIWLTL